MFYYTSVSVSAILSTPQRRARPVGGAPILSGCGLRSLWRAGLWQVSSQPLVSYRGRSLLRHTPRHASQLLFCGSTCSVGQTPQRNFTFGLYLR